MKAGFLSKQSRVYGSPQLLFGGQEDSENSSEFREVAGTKLSTLTLSHLHALLGVMEPDLGASLSSLPASSV